MFGGNYFGQQYFGQRSPSLHAIQTMQEEVPISDSILKQSTKVLTDVITISDNILRGMTQTLIDSLTLATTFTTQTIGKTLSEIVPLTEQYLSFKNGVRALWTKSTKTSGSWTNVAKTSSGVSGLWNKIKKRGQA